MKQIILALAITISAPAFCQMDNIVPSSGPVGIGTNTPTAGKQLTVSGNTLMYGELELDDRIVVDGQAILNDIVRMPSLAAFGGALDSFDIMVIDEFGQVSKSNAKTLFTALMYASPHIPDLCGSVDTLAPHWFTGVNKIFSPCPSVNVGIGTSTPDFKLDVIGETYTLKLLAGNDGGTIPAVLNAYVKNHDDPILRLGKKIGALAEEERFTINNDGAVEITNVGSDPAITINNGTGHAIVINDNSGQKIAQLQDDGLLRSRSIRVDLGTWADYVFDAQYDLMSLKEIKTFIAQNGHLPRVPNARDINRNGLDLGNMQQIQMEKIEELTLHLIEMDERMEQMAQELQELRKENNELKETIK